MAHGPQLSFTVAPTETIPALKLRIESATSVPARSQLLTLCGTEPDGERVDVAVAQAAVNDPRFSTKSVLALLRAEGTDAVEALLSESRTFDVLDQSAVHIFGKCHVLSEGLSVSTHASDTDFDCVSVATESSNEEKNVEFLSTSVFEEGSLRGCQRSSDIGRDFSLHKLTLQNRVRAAELRLLMEKRRLDF